jgi:hypothetical protein
MKTILVGLTLLGLTNLAYSQSPANQVNTVKLEEIVVSPMRNVSYFNSVNEQNSSVHVKKLQSEASNYDITTSKVFNNTFESYEVLFKSTYGSIIASYDSKGELLNSFEKFVEVLLPEKVVKTLKSNYSDWKLNSTTYLVNYYNNREVKKVYQVQLKKDAKKMNLKIDSNGIILNSSKNKKV